MDVTGCVVAGHGGWGGAATAVGIRGAGLFGALGGSATAVGGGGGAGGEVLMCALEASTSVQTAGRAARAALCRAVGEEVGDRQKPRWRMECGLTRSADRGTGAVTPWSKGCNQVVSFSTKVLCGEEGCFSAASPTRSVLRAVGFLTAMRKPTVDRGAQEEVYSPVIARP